MKISEDGIKRNSEMYFNSPSGRARDLFFYVICTGDFHYEKGYHLERDTYHSFLLMHIKKGTMKIQHEDTTYSVGAGETVLINCHQAHSYSALEDTDAIWFHFDGSNSKGIYEELKSEYGSGIVVRNSISIIRNLHKIYEFYRGKGSKDEAILSAYIARILSEFFVSHREPGSDKSLIVKRVVDYIDENFSRDLTVEELSKVAGLSAYYFSRVFKKYTGFTLHEYVVKSRITGAKILLKSTDLTLKEIAFRCGFSNESAFSNSFKKMTMMTAATFRKTGI